MIMLIFKKTIVFVQSARETCGCTRRFRTDPRGAGSAPPRGRPVARGPSADRTRRNARPRGPRRATPFAFRGGCGLCLTERALKRTKKICIFARCGVTSQATRVETRSRTAVDDQRTHRHTSHYRKLDYSRTAQRDGADGSHSPGHRWRTMAATSCCEVSVVASLPIVARRSASHCEPNLGASSSRIVRSTRLPVGVQNSGWPCTVNASGLSPSPLGKLPRVMARRAPVADAK